MLSLVGSSQSTEQHAPEYKEHAVNNPILSIRADSCCQKLGLLAVGPGFVYILYKLRIRKFMD